MQTDSSMESPVTARECEPRVNTPSTMLYRMARQGLIPCIRTGLSGRGVRFIPSEVLAALRARPAWEDPASPKRGKKRKGPARNEPA